MVRLVNKFNEKVNNNILATASLVATMLFGACTAPANLDSVDYSLKSNNESTANSVPVAPSVLKTIQDVVALVDSSAYVFYKNDGIVRILKDSQEVGSFNIRNIVGNSGSGQYIDLNKLKAELEAILTSGPNLVQTYTQGLDRPVTIHSLANYPLTLSGSSLLLDGRKIEFKVLNFVQALEIDEHTKEIYLQQVADQKVSIKVVDYNGKVTLGDFYLDFKSLQEDPSRLVYTPQIVMDNSGEDFSISSDGKLLIGGEDIYYPRKSPLRLRENVFTIEVERVGNRISLLISYHDGSVEKYVIRNKGNYLTEVIKLSK